MAAFPPRIRTLLTQPEIAGVLRSVARDRKEGIDGYYGPRRGRGGSVMTAEVTVQAEKLPFVVFHVSLHFAEL